MLINDSKFSKLAEIAYSIAHIFMQKDRKQNIFFLLNF